MEPSYIMPIPIAIPVPVPVGFSPPPNRQLPLSTSCPSFPYIPRCNSEESADSRGSSADRVTSELFNRTTIPETSFEFPREEIEKDAGDYIAEYRKPALVFFGDDVYAVNEIALTVWGYARDEMPKQFQTLFPTDLEKNKTSPPKRRNSHPIEETKKMAACLRRKDGSRVNVELRVRQMLLCGFYLYVGSFDPPIQKKSLTRERRFQHDLVNSRSAELMAIDTIRKAISAAGSSADAMQALDTLVVCQRKTSLLVEGHEEEINATQSDSIFSPRRYVELLKTNPKLAGKNIRLKCVISESVPDAVQSHFYEFDRILQNLLGNAIKFTRADSQIRMEISGSLSEEGFHFHMQMVLTDEGAGIHPSLLENNILFNEGIKHGEQAGQGIGLAYCHQTATALGGNLTARNREPPDHGAIFELILPFKLPTSPFYFSDDPLNPIASLTPPAPVLTESSPLKNKMKVMVVDDNELNRTITSRLLESLNCEVVSLSKGQEALALLQEAEAEELPFHLALFDNNLESPGYNGPDLIHRWNPTKDENKTPTVLLTGFKEPITVDGAAIEIYTKPISKEVLSELLKRIARTFQKRLIESCL